MILVLLQIGKNQYIETESKQLISFYSFAQIAPRNWNVKMTNWRMFWLFSQTWWEHLHSNNYYWNVG